MSPKEQAEKLVDIFYQRYAATDTCFGICENNSDICDGTGHGCGLWKQYARESAIICVEQIIQATGANKDENNGYWQRVLGHIKNS